MNTNDTKTILVLEPRATFGHGVGKRHAKQNGVDATYTFCRTNLELCRQLSEGIGHIAVVPMENNIAGIVPDWLLWCKEEMRRGESRLEIISEVIEPIEQKLMAKPGTSLDDIEVVVSHERAIRQCSKLLASMNVHARVVETTSTAAAAAMVAENTSGEVMAAIAAEAAADEYGLEIIVDKADDAPGNITRFGILQRKPAEARVLPAGIVRTIIVFDLPNAVGALNQVTGALFEHIANMTSILTLPQGLANRYSYSFYLEYEIDSSRADICLQALREITSNLVQLGNFIVHPRN
jgi:prephenate dehydratase